MEIEIDSSSCHATSSLIIYFQPPTNFEECYRDLVGTTNSLHLDKQSHSREGAKQERKVWFVYTANLLQIRPSTKAASKAQNEVENRLMASEKRFSDLCERVTLELERLLFKSN